MKVMPSVIVLLIILVLDTVNADYRYKVCSENKYTKECDQLKSSHSVICSDHVNTVNCMLDIDYGGTTFRTITAEEAFLAASLTSNVVVVGEFKEEIRSDDAEFELLVLVRSNQVTDGFQSVKGLKYCHPGNNFESNIVSPYMLKTFEMKALKENDVNICSENNTTLTETYVKALSEFFESACFPGAWTQDRTLDMILKNQHQNLRKLCSADSYKKNEYNPFDQALKCFLNEDGDIALTTRQDFFKSIDKVNVTSTRYFDFDGYTLTIDSDKSWQRKTGQLIVSHKDNKELIEDLKIWFSDYLSIGVPKPMANADKDLAFNLKKIVFPENDKYRLNILDKPTLLSEYIKDYSTIPNFEESKLCGRIINWCVTSTDEQNKCRWFQQAVLNYAIQPVIGCVKKNSKYECIEAIEKHEADIVTIEADQGYTAYRKNLFTIGHPLLNKNPLIRSLVVVKPDITRFDQLNGKRGCFSQYGGIAWASFVNVASEKGLSNIYCNYGKQKSDVNSLSSMPDARDANHITEYIIEVEKSCGLCEPHPAHENNLFYSNQDALDCLNQSGDFAVITLTDVISTDYTVLCRNNSLANYPGLHVDDDCYLSITLASQMITRTGDPLNDDIKLVLLEIDKYFSKEAKPSFELFGEFNGTKDLLFKDSTIGLEIDSNNEYALNHNKLFKNIDKYVKKIHKQEKSTTSSGFTNSPTDLVSYVIYMRLVILIIK